MTGGGPGRAPVRNGYYRVLCVVLPAPTHRPGCAELVQAPARAGARCSMSRRPRRRQTTICVAQASIIAQAAIVARESLSGTFVGTSRVRTRARAAARRASLSKGAWQPHLHRDWAHPGPHLAGTWLGTAAVAKPHRPAKAAGRAPVGRAKAALLRKPSGAAEGALMRGHCAAGWAAGLRE